MERSRKRVPLDGDTLPYCPGWPDEEESGPEENVTDQQFDDFLIVRCDVLGTLAERFAIVGPGLDPTGIRFATRAEAEQRGREIAQSSRVSLWREDAPRQPAILIATFRRAR